MLQLGAAADAVQTICINFAVYSLHSTNHSIYIAAAHYSTERPRRTRRLHEMEKNGDGVAHHHQLNTAAAAASAASVDVMVHYTKHCYTHNELMNEASL